MATTESSYVVGIDLGSQKIVVSVASRKDLGNVTVVQNDVSNRSTPTLISFNGAERNVGESAESQVLMNPMNTINELLVLIGISHQEFLSLPRSSQCRFVVEQDPEGRLQVEVDYRGNPTRFYPEQLLAMLLKQCVRFAEEAVKETSLPVIIAVPDWFSSHQHHSVLQAATIAGVNVLHLVKCSSAIACAYGTKHRTGEQEGVRYVMFVDMGHTSTDVSLFSFSNANVEPLVATAHSTLGSRNFDEKLYAYLAALCKDKYHVDVTFNSKRGSRLMAQCERVRKILSTVPEAPVELENFLEDTDIHFDVSREKLHEVCSEEQQHLTHFIIKAIERSGLSVNDIKKVELLGGGTRAPFVQNGIRDLVGEDKVSFTLDSSSSVAIGAALIGAYGYQIGTATPPCTVRNAAVDVSEEKGLSAELIQQAIQMEQEMEEADRQIQLAAHQRNAFESYIYEMKTACQGKHGSYFDSQVLPKLNEVADWVLYDSSDVSLDVLTQKFEEMKTFVGEHAPGYFEQLEKERAEETRRLEENAVRMAQERGEEDDHDFRKLKKEDRMRIVNKNKEEGNELFMGGNLDHAIKRYLKALLHTDKFFDLTEEDKQEVNQIKLSLYLNITQCWLKFDRDDCTRKAIDNVNRALELDPNSIKGLFRRALAYERLKNWEAAEKDLTKASSLAPEDGAIVRLLAQVKNGKKRDLEKEKKVYGKMFG
eukprot:GILJ01002651.1.p1 GENE.GILJ01002651.1~~GILJ01002651.1.p1  ORF type:complete len:707 (+),score=142.73 GILJ01002651.1:43-2163(+)